ncbi:flagellin [Vibrio crassostreae]|uniref:flagellin N-terminal helical domain-containing protein n=1 Tax=Vibrio crassostreae TaxID=246167 RepID=UPI00200A1726|nr:flagellin [Vibrio crassostreae]UPR32253.1 flagellin [Vibrio crassostreae]
MAISVHTNYASLVTQNTLQSTNNALTKSMEKLSTGFRINSAADDAAGLQIANRLNLQSRGLNVAMRNSQDAISMMQTAEGAMDEMTNIAYRMSDLATQAANGTYTDDDRQALDAEFGQLASELSNIFNNTSFGGKSLLTGVDSFGVAGGVTFQIGDKATNTLDVDLNQELSGVSSFTTGFNAVFAEQRAAASADFQAEADNFATGATTTVLGDGVDAGGITGTYDDFADLKAKAELDEGTSQADLAIVLDDIAISVSSRIVANAGVGGIYDTAASGLVLGGGTEYADLMAGTTGTLSISTQSAANSTIDEMSTLISNIGEARAKFGANINRLDHTITNLGNITENLDTSRGRIMDTDFAYESGMMSKSQMLMQSGASMLSASKMVPQLAMSLLG